MASFFSISSPALLSPTPHLSARSAFSKAQFKSGWAGRALKLPLNCSSRPNTDAEPEAESPPPPLSASPSLSASVSIYNWCAGLGGLGFLETGYLTYLKLTNSDAFCPVGGGTCSDVLNSDFATVFGVPLPLIGLIAYGFVTVLGVQLAANDLPFGMEKTNGRLILLGSTTSMAAASTYFLYILSTKFAGVSCSYCLMSALLSFSLFFITLKDFGLQEIKKELGLLICLGSLVVAALNTSYYTVRPVSTSLADIDLQPFTTEITTDSSPLALSLARHLHSIRAKMYGAFWCSHCLEQKQMFGREAAKLLDYVECFPQGYRKGTKIAKACSDAGIEGFPAWVINGEVLSGEQELPELARVSGFKLDDFSQPN